jgi:hypothetical protein
VWVIAECLYTNVGNRLFSFVFKFFHASGFITIDSSEISWQSSAVKSGDRDEENPDPKLCFQFVSSALPCHGTHWYVLQSNSKLFEF